MRGFLFLTLSAIVMICGVFEQPASARKRETVKVVFFGDSIGAGYGLFDPNTALPVLLEKQNRDEYYNFEITNLSVAGDTTASAITRLPEVIAAKPRIVVIALGGNDALRGIDPDIVYNNMDIILHEMARNGIYVLLCGMKAPTSMGYEYRSQFDRVFPVLAERAGVNFYPFLLDGVVGDRLLLQRDGIHPSREGVEHIAKQLGPYLRIMVLNVRTLTTQYRRQSYKKQLERERERLIPTRKTDDSSADAVPTESGAPPLPGNGN